MSARVEACREKRLASKDAGARKLGEERPYQFRDLNNPDSTLGKLLHDPELYNNLSNTAASMDALLQDIKKNPKRYISIKLL